MPSRRGPCPSLRNYRPRAKSCRKAAPCAVGCGWGCHCRRGRGGVLQDVLAETQSTIQPLVPYLDTLRWVLIAIALIGIAVTIHARLDDWKRGQR